MSDLFRSAWSYISRSENSGGSTADEFVGTDVEVGKQTLRIKKIIATG